MTRGILSLKGALAGGLTLGLALVGLSSAVAARTTREHGPVFADIRSASDYNNFRLELRLFSTGGVTRVLTALGQSWTNNGFAFSPDRRYIYFTLIPRSHRWSDLVLEQIAVATGRRRFVARGESPAVSPDSRLLAYTSVAGRRATVIVRDQGSGRAHSINISRLLGKPNNLFNATLAWLGDGRQLAVFPGPIFVAAGSSAREGARASARGKRQPDLVVVSVLSDGGLRARALTGAPELPPGGTVGTDTASSNTLIVGSYGRVDRAIVQRLRIGAHHATVAPVLTIAHSQIFSFDPSGRGILYLQGHRPPNLWGAKISGHHLTHRHLLIRKSPLEAVAG